jgi:hypothetical protein
MTMNANARRAFTVLQLVVFAICSLIAAGVVSLGSGTADAVSGNAGPITVTVNPTSGVGDGTSVAIHAEAPDGVLIYSLKAHLCRPGRPITSHYDWSFSGLRCPGVAVGNGDVEQGSSYGDGTQSADVPSFKVGEGAINFVNVVGHQATIDCGPGKPCDVVVDVEITNDEVFYTAPLCYGDRCPPEGQASDTPPPPSSAPPLPVAGSDAAAQGAQGNGGAAPAGNAAGSSGSPSSHSTGAGAKATAKAAPKAKSSTSVHDTTLEAASAATTTTASDAGLSRQARVFIAAVAGALGTARIIAVVKRTRRRRSGGLGLA